jgi:hypothetical protein
MPTHEKYAPLSDAAFRLAITAGCWCAERMTDGFIPKAMVPQLTAAPRGKKLAQCIAELTRSTAKLSPVWEDRGDEYELHDFLDWNMSRSEWETKVAAASAGGRAKAAKRIANMLPHGSHMAEHTASSCCSKSLPPPLPDSDSDSEINLTAQIQGPESSERTGRLQERAAAAVRNPYDGRYDKPEKWPEIRGNVAAFARFHGVRHKNIGGIPGDKGVMALLGLYAAGISSDDVERAIEYAKDDAWFTKQPRGLASLSLEVVRRLLDSSDRSESRIEQAIAAAIGGSAHA